MQEISLKKNQSTVYEDLHRFIVLIAGRRWAKTTTLLVKLRDQGAFENPGLYGYFAPTYRQAKLIAWDVLKSISPRIYVSGKPNESELSISYINGAKIRLFGLDNPEGILGVKLAGAVIDEYDNVKNGVFESVIRPALSDSMGFCWFAGTPDSRSKRLKDLFQDIKINKREDWSAYHFRSIDGGYIPAEEIENARRDLDPRTFREQYEATFEDQMGQVYYAFSFDDNVSSSVEYNPNLPLSVFWDFNVDPLCVGFGHRHEGRDDFRNKTYRLDVFGELILRNSNTPEMCRAIIERFKNHKAGIVHYGDATSKSRNTASCLSDYQIIFDHFKNFPNVSLKFKDSNPHVKDRVNAVNSMLLSADGKRRLKIHPSCKKLIKDLLDVSYKEGTNEMDKSNIELTHISDGLGYWIDYDFPVTRNYVRNG